MDGSQATSDTSPTDLVSTDLAFGYLASSLAQLLEVVRRELEHDREAAKASLAAASTILQSEIERHSGAKQSGTAGLTAWQIARVRAFIEKNLDRTIHTRDLSAVARRSPAHFSRSFKLTFGEPPHAYVVKRRLEKACSLMVTSSASLSEIALSGFFGSGAPLQVVQTSFWPKPGQLAARTRDAIRWIKPAKPAPIRNIPWAMRTGKF